MCVAKLISLFSSQIALVFFPNLCVAAVCSLVVPSLSASVSLCVKGDKVGDIHIYGATGASWLIASTMLGASFCYHYYYFLKSSFYFLFLNYYF